MSQTSRRERRLRDRLGKGGGHEAHSSLWGASQGSGWAGQGGLGLDCHSVLWVQEAGEAVVSELEGLTQGSL